MTTTLILLPPETFINANVRLHHHAKAKLTRAWRQAARDSVALAVMCGDPIPLQIPRAQITVAIRFPNNIRRDVGNYYPTAKAIVDGLVDSGLLPDDNDRHLIGPDMRRHIPNGSPLVTVTITPLEETP